MEIELVIVPVVMGLVEVVKRVGVPVRFAPLLAVVLGGLSVFVVDITPLMGIVYGLTACGLYSGVKTSLDK